MSPRASDLLVLQLCHEVGNLLAATRLQAGLADPRASRVIAELAARAGALLALVRPLLVPPASPASLHPLALLEALTAALDDPRDCRLRVELGGAAALPALRVEPDALQPLVLAELFAALAELPEGGQLQVRAEPDPGGVAVVLEGPGHEPPQAPVAGRALTRALAEAILGRRGGVVRAHAGAGRLRVALVAPAA